MHASVQLLALPVMAFVERNLLGVRNKFSVQLSVAAFKVLLLSGKFAESWRYIFDQNAGKHIPAIRQGGSFVADKLRKFACEQN